MALAIDFQQALIMASAQPELIICDLNMSGAGLLAGVDGMIQIAPNSPLLVIIDGEDDALLIDLLDRCVAGVASKSASGAIIDAALRLILAGGRYFPPRVADIARCGIDDQPTSGDLPGNAARLTGRQIEVLKLIAEGHSNKAIAKILGLAPSTVKSHISQVFSCLGAINRTDASIKARRLGLI
jgi:DNA-binding NarL/FixJ family response regulator